MFGFYLRTAAVRKRPVRHHREALVCARPSHCAAALLGSRGTELALTTQAATEGGHQMRLSRPPPLRNLRAFCAAARQGSFKFAAVELCLTPSAVSHQMKELEAALGVRLFERKTRSLELTPVGLRLLEEVEPLLDALDRALTQLARSSGRQTLRVRLPALFASELFIPRLASFCETHPLIDLQLDAHDPRPRSHPATADVSILLTDSAPPGLKSVRLFSSSLAAVRAAERGLGLALVPTPLCDSWLRSGALVRVFAVELATREAYYLVSRPKDVDRPQVKALTRWALAQYQRG